MVYLGALSSTMLEASKAKLEGLLSLEIASSVIKEKPEKYL
jgi:hypothetical protein